ncbi:MAG: hypothetical protein AB8A35_06150 [Prochlorococcus sp.]
MPSSTMDLASQKGCRLAIGAYPAFSYDASSGGGKGILGPAEQTGLKTLHFDPQKLFIPDLNWRTTKILGLPMPPGLNISVKTERLEGYLATDSGKLILEFEARFRFTVGNLITAPDLMVKTCLSSDSVQSQRHHIKGQALKADGSAVLVGVANVPPSGARWLDNFLGLPDEALAVLRCKLSSN